MNKITATLAIAAVTGASVAIPSMAFADGGNSSEGTQSIIYLWKAPNRSDDRVGPSPKGLAHGYPQSYVGTFPANTSWADIEGTLPRPKCGETLTYQADLYKATKSQLNNLGTTLEPGEDSKIGKAWYVYILRGAPCKSETPAPTKTKTIEPSVPVPTSTRTIPTRAPSTTSVTTSAPGLPSQKVPAGVPTVTPQGPATPPVSSQDGAGVLPYTGSQNGLAVLVATVLLFGGGALLLVARRKS